MNRIKVFYRGLSQKNRIIFWICFAVILLSLFAIGRTIYRATTSKNPTIENYMKQIRSKDPAQRQTGVYTVGLYRVKEMADTLENMIKQDPEIKVKRVAAWSLGRIDINRLVKLLDSNDTEIKNIAMDALIKLDKNNVSYMMERFNTEDIETRKKILSTVESLKKPDFNESLMEIAENKDENKEIRFQALNILKDTGTMELEGRLNAIYYNDPDMEMKEAAKHTLESIKQKEKNK
ncbi:MAG TPA: HEAT repeat domain-containing protein [bacterium]|nr:HEAT repeat domain-containing protein [bacterium]HOL35151.1 HEAT repeat domain-containing protein [bacterium]HPP08437.1 HEAT repeat domain-containing protein [bacterium]